MSVRLRLHNYQETPGLPCVMINGMGEGCAATPLSHPSCSKTAVPRLGNQYQRQQLSNERLQGAKQRPMRGGIKGIWTAPEKSNPRHLGEDISPRNSKKCLKNQIRRQLQDGTSLEHQAAENILTLSRSIWAKYKIASITFRFYS